MTAYSDARCQPKDGQGRALTGEEKILALAWLEGEGWLGRGDISAEHFNLEDYTDDVEGDAVRIDEEFDFIGASWKSIYGLVWDFVTNREGHYPPDCQECSDKWENA